MLRYTKVRLLQEEKLYSTVILQSVELSKEENDCFLALYTSDYESHKNRNPKPTAGTCRWILEHEKYKHWEDCLDSNLLWISADPGCGKSVLATFLVDELPNRPTKGAENLCYFFFKNDSDEQKSSTYALCAALHQIYTFQPELLKHALPQFTRKGSTILKQYDTLWSIFKATIEDPEADDTIFLIDGLDECEDLSRHKLITSLARYFKDGQAHLTAGPSVKVIITSRPDNAIKGAFQNLAGIRLRGEDETTAISDDVELVIKESIGDMEGSGLPRGLLNDLQDNLIKGADRTFLWTTLTIKLLRDASERGASKQELDEILRSRDIDEVYGRLLKETTSPSNARKMLQIVIAAARPLTLDEMNVAMAIPPENAARANPISTRELFLANANPPRITSLDVLESHLKLSFENFVKSLCGHFLRIINQRIYLVHQTAREYLLKPDSSVEGGADQHHTTILTFTEEESALEMTGENSTLVNRGLLTGVKVTTIAQGPLQHSLTTYGSTRELLDICVSYLYLFAQKHNSNDPLLKGLLDYAANYWTVHFKQLIEFGREDVLSPRYRLLVNPEFGGFETWTSAHISYKLNFPGRMLAPGTAAASDYLREFEAFFGLEESCFIPKEEKAMSEAAFGINNTFQYEDQDSDEVNFGKEKTGGEDEDQDEVDEKKSRITDRFQSYRRLQSWQNQAELGSRTLSVPTRGHSFPVKGDTLLKLNSTKPKECRTGPDRRRSNRV